MKSIVFALVVWLLLRTFLFEAFRIPSQSMENTLLVGDWLFVNKAVYGAEVPLLHWHFPKYRDPARSDLVIFDSVEEEGLKVVKRVIGLPGDTLEMRQHVIYRNGAVLNEPYALYDDTMPADGPEFPVPCQLGPTAGVEVRLDEFRARDILCPAEKISDLDDV